MIKYPTKKEIIGLMANTLGIFIVFCTLLGLIVIRVEVYVALLFSILLFFVLGIIYLKLPSNSVEFGETELIQDSDC